MKCNWQYKLFTVMPQGTINSKSVIRNFFLIFTSVCTIFSFLYIILGSDEWTAFVAYYFVVSFAIFLVVVVTLLGMFLFRLEPGIQDGRYLLLIIPSLLFVGSGYLYYKEYNPANKWGLIFLTIGLAVSVIVIILILFSWSTKVFTSSENTEFIVNSVSSKLMRLGDNEYEYDVYKDIQSRVPILTSIETRFKWTGDKVDPNQVKVSSVTHNIEKIRVDDQGYDSLRLFFKSPLYYKQAFTCHYKISHLTDKTSPAEPYISHMVKSNETISLICFDVVLKDVDNKYNKEAIFQKRKESAPQGAKYQEIMKVPFDIKSKSYHYDYPNPEPGYDYQLYWGDK